MPGLIKDNIPVIPGKLVTSQSSALGNRACRSSRECPEFSCNWSDVSSVRCLLVFKQLHLVKCRQLFQCAQWRELAPAAVDLLSILLSIGTRLPAPEEGERRYPARLRRMTYGDNRRFLRPFFRQNAVQGQAK